MSAKQACLVLTTVAKKRDADRIGRLLVQESLVACVQQLGPITSHYVWKKKLCCDREFLLLIKTKRSLVGKLEKRLHEVHPYEVPEFVVVPFVAGSKGYLRWMSLQL